MNILDDDPKRAEPENNQKRPLLFFLIMLTGYVYVWRKGVFDWGHER